MGDLAGHRILVFLDVGSRIVRPVSYTHLPDQWLDRPDILEADIRLMKEAHINCVSVAIFAWAKLEPEEGRYEFDWLEKVIDNLYENGIYTVLATPSGSKPLWMSEKYPEIRRVSACLLYTSRCV